MLRTYREVTSCAPSQQDDVYIFAVAPVMSHGIAAISSSDELLILDRDGLRAPDAIRLRDVPRGLTSLVILDEGTAAACAGSDGTVAVFDIRSQSRVAHFKQGKAVNALAGRANDLAIGSEALVAVWDRRQTRIRWQNNEVNDEITALDFHPSKDNVLLSGGDDGLVSIFDTLILEEEDSLLQAVNHGPIHKAGFLSQDNLYALSSDQNLALHSLTIEDVDSDMAEPAPDQLGDLRPIIPCEYVIDILHTGPDHVVACGSHSQSRVDLVKVDRGTKLSLDHRIVLESAHGGEVVRSIFADDADGTIYTAGEDGRISAFRAASGSESMATPTKGTKSKKGADARYKPY